MPFKTPNALLHGTLDALILKTLTTGPRHGYAIAKFIEDASDESVIVEEGSLYPALYRMERRGWLEAEWGESELGRRHRTRERDHHLPAVVEMTLISFRRIDQRGGIEVPIVMLDEFSDLSVHLANDRIWPLRAQKSCILLCIFPFCVLVSFYLCVFASLRLCETTKRSNLGLHSFKRRDN